VSRFEDKKLLLVGDDLMSQFGGTIFHKGILEFLGRRGIKLVKSYQLDVGGGIETLNTIDEMNRGIKRDIKTAAISVDSPNKMEIVTGTTEYVDYMGNDRTSYYMILGEGFFGSPIKMDVYLRTSDGPNGANILFDTIRSVQVCKDKGKYGASNEISAFGFKKPMNPVRLSQTESSFQNTFLRD
jgi:myo-inositol-1-phosphate synthase